MNAKDDCPRHQCGSCGRFVVRTSVRHGGGYPDYEYWANGRCARCGAVDVACVPIHRRSGGQAGGASTFDVLTGAGGVGGPRSST